MVVWRFLLNLARDVRGILQPAHGGTGSTYGEARVVGPYTNSTGATLALYTLVQLSAGANDKRVKKVVDTNSTKVLGVVVGYYDDDGSYVAAACPDGREAAVQTAGECPILIESAVTRDQYAFAAATDGTIVSSATVAAGAFGRVIDSADTSTGTTTARVQFPLTIYPGGGATPAPVDATYLVKTAHADLTSEEVVGATPGGELGGTWAAPTVDATHAGSAHHTEAHDHSTVAQGANVQPAARFGLSGAATSASTTGDITDLDVTNSIYRWAGASAGALHGVVRGADVSGRMLVIVNNNSTGGAVLTLKHQSATEATTSRRIICNGGVDMPIAPAEGVVLLYDETTSRWRALAIASDSVHTAADTDDSATALHHTLGLGAFQAAAGSHTHSAGGGVTSPIYFADYPPASPHANDDEFSDGSVDGDWTEYDHGAIMTPEEGDYGLVCAPTSASIDKWVGYSRDLPRIAGAGDWTVVTKVAITNEIPAAGDWFEAGIVLYEDPTVSTGDLIALSLGTVAAGAMRRGVTVRRYTQYDNTTPTELFAMEVDGYTLASHMYLRVRRSGTTYIYDWSSDGIGWTQFFSHTPPFTVAKVGLGLWKGSNRGARAYFLFWRQLNSADLAAPIAGQIINL